jgi:carboxymethylenebutenolidase
MDVLTPSEGHGPGVLVLHPWWGLNRTIRDYGAALAREGFVVGLPDLFEGDTTTSIPEADKLVEKHWAHALDRILPAVADLMGHPAIAGEKIGAVGFSYGGFQLLRFLGKDPRLVAAAVYYATGPDADLSGTAVMAHYAEHDQYESDADRDATLAKLPAERGFIYPGTDHWFAEKDRPEYREDAASLAFRRTVTFLRDTIAAN